MPERYTAPSLAEGATGVTITEAPLLANDARPARVSLEVASLPVLGRLVEVEVTGILVPAPGAYP